MTDTGPDEPTEAQPPVGLADGPAAAPERDAAFRRKRQEWRRTEKARRYAARKSVRFPIFTRSVLLWCLIFALIGVAFGASGAFWWANFNTEVSELRDKVDTFENLSQDAVKSIEDEKAAALADLNNTIAPLRGLLSEVQVIQLAPLYAPYVYTVETLDEEGAASPGTAFAVASTDSETIMLTSYDVVKAATVQPGPGIELVKGGERIPVELWDWDAPTDLALLKVDRGGLQVLDWADDAVMEKALGSRVFPVGGLGGAGASLTSGVINDQSSAGLQHTAEVGTAWRGAPIINIDGKVLGVASLAYEPLNFDPGEVHFAPPINVACTTVIACGGGIREAEQEQRQAAAEGTPVETPGVAQD